MIILNGFIIGLVMAGLFSACSSGPSTWLVESPDGALAVELHLSASGELFYDVAYGGEPLIEAGRMGLERSDANFSDHLQMLEVLPLEVLEESYQLHAGKYLDYKQVFNQQVFRLKNSDGALLELELRLADDGLAYRYRFPEAGTEEVEILQELSSYRFSAGTKGFLSPLAVPKSGWEATNPSYEENYYTDVVPGTPSPLGYGWVYPALFQKGDLWMLVAESDLHRAYCGTRLVPGERELEYRLGFPDERETFTNSYVNPRTVLPLTTPWRLMAVGDLATILTSSLGTDLAAPAVEGDFSWVKPGRASWSWIMLKDESITWDVQKAYIDFAADMGWEYCLVDVSWDRMIGRDRMGALSAYAQSKGVGLILWYNSAGDWNTTPYTPRDRMLTRESRRAEMAWLQEIGVKGIKVDFFGGDGQPVIAYYHDLFRDAADFGLTVNTHGTTLPRGWQRTYPNFLTNEAVKGMEFITFEQENADQAPFHNVMQVFTRNVFDPMDYTPMNFSGLGHVERKTTVAHELALPFLFTSGIQHLAETPQGMLAVPAYVRELVKQMPVAWTDLRFLGGYPGKDVVLARKADDGWYVAGINGEAEAKTIELDLTFIGDNVDGLLVGDGEAWGTFSSTTVQSGLLEVELQPNGGFVLYFSEE